MFVFVRFVCLNTIALEIVGKEQKVGAVRGSMTVRVGSVLVLAALAFGAFDCAVYSDSLLGSAGSADSGVAGGTAGNSSADQGGNSGSTTSSAGSTPAGGGEIGLGSAGDDSSIAGNGGDAGNPSGGAVAAGGMTSSGGAGMGGTAGKGGATAAGGTSGSAGKGGTGGTAGTAGTSGSAGVGNTSGTAGTAGTSGTAGTAGTAGTGGTSGSAGTGGSGGSVVVPMCSDHALTAKSGWNATASASHTGEPATFLTDNTTSRWSSGVPQAGNEWIQIDFGAVVTLRSINLQQGLGADANDYPRGYAVIISNITKDLTGTVRATGVGNNSASTTITLSGVFSGRYLLIKQTGTSLSWWSIEEVEVSCFDL